MRQNRLAITLRGDALFSNFLHLRPWRSLQQVEAEIREAYRLHGASWNGHTASR